MIFIDKNTEKDNGIKLVLYILLYRFSIVIEMFNLYFNKLVDEPPHEETCFFCIYAKTKAQISCAAPLILLHSTIRLLTKSEI